MSILCSIVGANFATVAAAVEVLRRKNGIRAVGNAQVSTAQSKFGGSSALFDGSGDYLTLGAGSVTNDLALTGTTWTVEYWARITSHMGQYQATVAIWNDVDGIGNTYYFSTNMYDTTQTMGFQYMYGSGTDSGAITFGTTLATGTWQHHAFVRNGNTLTAYLDGVSKGTHDMTGRTIDITGYNNSGTNTVPVTIGGMSTGQGSFNGYLDEVRISKTARYTANFTAPTAPFVNDDNTVLLVHANGTDGTTFFEDDNGSTTIRTAKTITVNGNAQLSTAQEKFGQSSMLFDGTGDYLIVPASNDFAFGTGNWTIELWFRRIADASGVIDVIVGNRNEGFGSGNFVLYTYSSSVEFDYRNDLVTNNTLTTTISNNTWYHFAVVRNGTSLTLYKDGAVGQTKTIGASETFGLSSYNLSIGCNTQGTFPLNGYIDELRISKVARYTAAFTAPTTTFENDANTLLLIHADGADASTTITDDNSGRSPIGIFATGNAQIDTAQSQFGGASVLFDGTGDYLTCATPTTAFDFGAGNFTIEFWMRASSLGATIVPLAGRFSGSIFGGQWWCELTPTNRMYWGFKTQDSANTYYPGDGSSGATFSTGVWYHIAVVRNGNSMQMYRNGTAYGSAQSVSGSFGYTGDIWVGSLGPGGYWLNGWIDEVRVSKIARYTANFTAPTTPFVNDSNTTFLMHGDGTDGSTVFRDDNGITGFTPKPISVAANAQISTAQYKFGNSSALFDGTDDYIRLGSNGLSDYYFGNRDFTIELWFRTSAKTRDYPMLIGNTDNGNFTTDRWQLFDRHLANSTKLILYLWNYSNSTPILTSTTSISNNTWYHIAITRSGSLFTLWVNGVSESTATFAGAIDSSGRFISIGGNESAAVISYNGHIDEVRISNSCRYTAAFTPATAPFTSDSNTISLLHMDGANASTTFVDSSGRKQNGIQAIGNTNVSTAQSKFGGSSAYFDGTGDYLTVPNNSSLSFPGDHTIECWIRLNATPGFPSNNTIYHSNFLFYLAYYNNGGAFYELDVFLGGGNQVSTGSSGSLSLSTNTWYHIAFVKNSGNYKIFLDGVVKANTTYDAQLVSEAANYIGGSPTYGATNWFIDEFRISNSARYTAAFTPPTAPFQNDDNTVLLLHMDGTNGSTVFFDDNGAKPYTL